MVRVIAKQQQGAQIYDLPAYSMRTMHNQARMGWRKQPALEELHENDASTLPAAMERLICADTLRAIETLPEKQAQILRMVSEGDTSPKDLALRTGWPIGTVMSRLARARIRLKEILEIPNWCQSNEYTDISTPIASISATTAFMLFAAVFDMPW
jgi:DNA-directed RNA polymerase specialized sigma24 family protein